jgi:O-antigen ligase
MDTLLRRLVLAAACVATLGLLQFATGQSFLNYLHPPGLVENSVNAGVGSREGFVRPVGTALSPIEFGVAVTMLVPIALHYALRDTHRHVLVRWLPVVVLTVAIPISISRSAILGAIVALGLMFPVMTARARVIASVGAVGVTGLIYVAVPGMLGTLVGLFTGIGNDASAESRTDSYSLAFEFIQRSPFVGRGLGTFLPDYRILDNQFLLTTIEMGLIGLLALLGLFVTAMWSAVQVRRRTDDRETSQLAQALLASLSAGAVSFALFDALSFPQVMGLTFVMLGMIASLRRITPIPRRRGRRAEPLPSAPPAPPA